MKEHQDIFSAYEDDQDLLAHATRFRFGKYEVRKCKGWWEIFWEGKKDYGPAFDFIANTDGTYEFTREEAIETARRLSKEDK